MVHAPDLGVHMFRKQVLLMQLTCWSKMAPLEIGDGIHVNMRLAVFADNLGWEDLDSVAGFAWDCTLHHDGIQLCVNQEHL